MVRARNGRASQIVGALRRVDRFGDFLTRVDSFQSVSTNGNGEEENVRDCQYASNLPDNTTRIDSSTTTRRIPSKSIVPDNDESSYIGCISFDYVVETSSAVKPTEEVTIPIKNETKTNFKRRNNRFQRFVAAKQNQRAKTLVSHTEEKASSSSAKQSDSISEITDESGFGIPTVIVQYQVKANDSSLSSSASGMSMSECNAEELPTTALDRYRSERHHPPTQYSPDHSPTSVRDLPPASVSLRGSDYDKLPRMGEEHAAKKRVFTFIRVESNSNPKGIIQRKSCGTNGTTEKRQKKNLTWWDDDVNIDKPFTLRTDESFCSEDESSTWYPVPSCSCNDDVQDYFAPRLSSSASGMCMSECNTEELPMAAADSDGYHSETRFPPTQCNPDHSPTSVRDLLPASVSLCSSDHDKLPSLGQDRAAKKRAYTFKRVESNSNPKGIIKRTNYETNGTTEKRQKKNLTWWDDDVNRYKPFMLKTDESFCSEDESSTWYPVPTCNFLAGQKKRVRWIDEVPELERFTLDEERDPNIDLEGDLDDDGDDSTHHYTHFDRRQRTMIEDLVDYYRERIEGSFSQVVDAGKDSSMDPCETITSMRQDDRMVRLCKVDLCGTVLSSATQDEDYSSLGGYSNATPQPTCTFHLP